MNHGGYMRLMMHNYWHRKDQFTLDRDSYPYWTLFAVEDGRFAFSIRDLEGEAGFGDMVICPPNTWFHRKTLSPLTFHFLHFCWEPEAGIAEEYLCSGKVRISDAERLSSNYRYLKLLALQRDPAAALAHKQHLLNDLWQLAAMERELHKDTGQKSSDPDMLQARQHLLANAYGTINMRSLADSLRLTPVQLTRRFRAVYGVNPSDFVTEHRLNRASRLLEETTLSIDKIAQLSGYENGFYLSRIFRQKRGMTPSFYRRTHRV
ncbi:AraC family transcriptional regulator [Paenibacillus jiagnxiensis]|uniref:AraC family transcriptional regulator n=1 Tax=Paenibacillus jiagnxiensis TaxID=3228926 RepID=UPI0033AF87C7